MADAASSPGDLLSSLLREVSRSFYLTLRVLPTGVRSPIGLAYLLARATDTVADTDALPVERRLEALGRLRDCILGREPNLGAALAGAAGAQALPAERQLLERLGEALAVLRAVPEADRRRIQEVLEVITGGQELDLRRFAVGKPGAGSGRGPGPAPVVALATGAELDDYTYRVAGCVGEFWTRMCVAHLFPSPVVVPGQPDGFEECGVRFGKGLQLVNILRDLPRDLRNGRCYLPADELARVGMAPADLLDPANEGRMRPVYDAWLERAWGHLAAGWEYTCVIPSSYRRLRLACAWPVLIGVRTLVGLEQGAVLDPSRRIKVTRSEVYGLMFRSVLALRSAGAWRAQWTRASAGRRR